MEFRILGPLEVLYAGEPIALRGAKQRALLAELLIHAGEVVSKDRLIDAVWGDDPPDTATAALQVYVSQLRKLLQGSAGKGSPLVTRSPGYVLHVRPGELDRDRFEALVEQGRKALEEGEPERASSTLREALTLWRGPALADFAYEAFARTESERLEEERIAALEDRIQSDLACGRHELTAELESLVTQHPTRERLRAQLMLALYRAGRQADALRAYQQARETLAEELGIDPGPQLRQLEKAILNQDPALEPTVPERPPPRTEVVEPAAPVDDAPRPEGEERRIVTVLACELAELTTSANPADPEDLRARLQASHARLRADIERFGGTVERFVGDGVVAVFGAPVAHEDDAERAVRAGLRIAETAAELNENDASLDIRARIGVDTGEAVVALGARPEQGESVVTGDVVNAASSLQAAAPAGAVAVGEQTWRSTGQVFDYEALGPGIWCARSPRARFGTDVTRVHDKPLVGRELDLTILRGAFEKAIKERTPQLVTIVGEPGIGKSRLVAELLAHADALPDLLVTWRQGRCLPYGEGITFWALGEIVKAQAGIFESDPPEAADSKLEAALPADSAEREWLRQRLLPLVGLEATSTAEREEQFTAWRRFLESIADSGPAVFVFEDLHWADDAMLAFVEHLADWSQGVPMLVVSTARPELFERHPTFAAAARNATRINLAPLTETETAQLVSVLLDSAVLPAEVQLLVLDRSGGNPLYAEELVRLLNDRGLIVRTGRTLALVEGATVGFPESIQALIAARLDTLAPDRKALLADASVVGKVFWREALLAMSGRDDHAVAEALHELSRSEFLRPARVSSMAGAAEFGFWHILVRDVAYSQIPRAQRAEKHRQAAAWIESVSGDRVEDHADVLAHHYTTALELTRASGDDERANGLEAPALRYLALAGDRSLGLDTAKAEQSYAKALVLASRGNPERAGVLVRWADSLSQDGRQSEAVEALEEAVSTFRQDGKTADAARALTALGRVLWVTGDPRSRETMAEAASLLESGPPGPDLIHAYGTLAGLNAAVGAYREGVEWAGRALSVAARLGLGEPPDPLGVRGVCRVILGDPDGLSDMRRALAVAVEEGSGRAAAIQYSNLSLVMWPIEGPAEALAAGEEGIAFAEARGIRELVLGMRTSALHLHYELGHFDEILAAADELEPKLAAGAQVVDLTIVRATVALVDTRRGKASRAAPVARAALEAARESGGTEELTETLAAWASACLGTGDGSEALTALAEALRVPEIQENPQYPMLLPEMVRTAVAAGAPELAGELVSLARPVYAGHEHAVQAARAVLAEGRGDLEEAASLYADSAKRWAEFGNVVEEAFALVGLGRCALLLGRRAEASEPLVQARKLFADMGASPHVEEADILLAQATALTS